MDDAVAKGARVLAGGEAVGPCFQATLLTDVPHDSDLAQHETFGPVAAIEIVDGAEEAVDARERHELRAQRGDHHDGRRPRVRARAAASTRGSCMSTTSPVGDEPQMPFGGVKDSGFGRFGGQAVIDEFTELRWITVQSGAHPFPF